MRVTSREMLALVRMAYAWERAFGLPGCSVGFGRGGKWIGKTPVKYGGLKKGALSISGLTVRRRGRHRIFEWDEAIAELNAGGAGGR